MAVINMSKNQKISMVKEDGTGIKNFFIGVNWDQNRYAGEADIDFDINGFNRFKSQSSIPRRFSKL